MAVEEYPLFLDISPPAFTVNYMRNVRTGDWNIRSFPTPVYLYQPDVAPGPDGGHVTTEQPTRRLPRKGQFVEQTKRLDPDEQHWLFATADGHLFKGTPDTLSNCAILRRKDDTFQLQLVDRSIRFFEERLPTEIKDADMALRKMKEDRAQRTKRLKKIAPFLLERADQEMQERQIRAKQELDMDHDARIDHSDVESDGAPDLDLHAQSDEGLDPVDDGDTDALEEVSDVDVNALFAEEDEHEEEEDAKEKEKEKRPKVVDTVAKAAQKNEDIVSQILGPEAITEEDVRLYMRDVGFCTPKELKLKFNDQQKDHDRYQAFRRLCSRLLTKFERDGRVYLKLKLK